MARKKNLHRLPPLPKGPLLRVKDHKAERLLEILRGIAVSNQEEEPKVFYPLRDVALRFEVPVSTAARVYRRLEIEGILNRVRGSKTVLQGLSSARRISVRGLIAMPASLSCFLTLQDYRVFFMRTRREFRKRGFVTSSVFFSDRSRKPDELFRNITDCNVDTVLWYLPNISTREVAFRLRDLGIRVIAVSDGGVPGIRCQYRSSPRGRNKNNPGGLEV